MCKIIDQQMFSEINSQLTSKVVRKHFPQGEAYPVPREVSDRAFAAGEEFVVNIKVWANNSKALKHRRTFKRYNGALTVIDLAKQL